MNTPGTISLGYNSLGFDDEFLRMWLFYFAYCEGGFEEKVISDVHLHITKPGYRNSL